MTVVFTTAVLNGTDDGGGDGNINARLIFPAGVLSAAAGATQVRVTLLMGTGCPTISGAITSCWVGRGAGSGSQNYNGNQTQCLFGGSSSANVSAAASILSDWATFAASETFDNTKDLIVAYHILNGSATTQTFSALAGIDTRYDFGTDNAGATTGGLANDLPNSDSLIAKIEMQTTGGPAFIAKTFEVLQATKRGSYF